MEISTTYEGQTYSGDLREDKSVAVQPLGVLGVELHELVEKDVGNRRHTPRNNVSQATPYDSDVALSFFFFLLFLLLSIPLTWARQGGPSWR